MLHFILFNEPDLQPYLVSFQQLAAPTGWSVHFAGRFKNKPESLRSGKKDLLKKRTGGRARAHGGDAAVW